MKAYGGVVLQLISLLSLSARGESGQVNSPTALQRHIAQAAVGGDQNRFARFGEEKNLLSLPETAISRLSSR
jgi:hypothetical protein